ncbi:tyrosine protein kinase Blk [Echinococcus multilocularis]|uniref:Tyrosine-protein kinase n=1 Tax=Echinococcus multilocularis TaxID=6211 RepID=A0A068XW12_ECHMU|nr:tyrosine protein kinase Blk [Echinococcus multilocularis]
MRRHYFFRKFRNRRRGKGDRSQTLPRQETIPSPKPHEYVDAQPPSRQESNLYTNLHNRLGSPHPQPNTPTGTFPVEAICGFTATQPDECGFIVGDLLCVTNTSSDWWIATNLRTKEKGFIPANCVTSDMSLSIVLEAWFDINRLEVECRLLLPAVQTGTYILRPCKDPRSPYYLSVRALGVDTKHFQVCFDGQAKKYHISGNEQFSTFRDLIMHYHSRPIDGEVGLIEPCPRKVDYVIQHKDVKMGKEVGKGNFGVVYLSHVRGMEVAVKRCFSITNDQAFREVVEMMQKLSHQRIVHFHGICCDAPDDRVLIITEFMVNGALRDYLRTPEGRQLDYPKLVCIIVQVFPYRWTAPEAMEGSFHPNVKSDVWSFGVLMFEVLTYGETPYKDCTRTQLRKFLSEGGRLSSPQYHGCECEARVYCIMRSCWDSKPEQRPTFKKLKYEIEQCILDGETAFGI